MGTDINIVEAQNDLKTVKQQAEEMRTAFPTGTYMNKGLSKIIGTINERLDRWDSLEAETEVEEDIIDMEVDIQDEEEFPNREIDRFGPEEDNYDEVKPLDDLRKIINGGGELDGGNYDKDKS